MPRGIKKKPFVVPPIIGSELKEGEIPVPRIINQASFKEKCLHALDHHDKEKKWCNSCGCLKYNGCGE